MPKEIFPSSFECDCGHQSHFFENTVKEMRAESSNNEREIVLVDDGDPSHRIYFLRGTVVAIFCPIRKRLFKKEKNKAAQFTSTQGQYLAFIYYYTKLNSLAPSERDMQIYFKTTPPSVHNMVLTLQKKGFISRVPGAARSIRVLLEKDQLPDLG